jgi:hypothetical protein
MRWFALLVTLAIANAAVAEPTPLVEDPNLYRSPRRIWRGEVQADLGLAVIGVGYERAAGNHLALQGEAHVFGTYFLPWFSQGDSLAGGGLGIRATWFSREYQDGLYVAPFVRLDELGAHGDSALGYSAGAFVGWAVAFGTYERIHVRIGAGAQYMHYRTASSEAVTPFPALDLVIGYRI